MYSLDGALGRPLPLVVAGNGSPLMCVGDLDGGHCEAHGSDRTARLENEVHLGDVREVDYVSTNLDSGNSTLNPPG